jgi:hypothetical protein
MQDACPRTAAKQVGQEVERGMEKSQARQSRQKEQQGNRPVVHSGAVFVALQVRRRGFHFVFPLRFIKL